jgi:arylsulfatase A-like enzyme
MLKDTLVVAIGEFGRSPRMGVSTSGNANAPDGRDHWPYCYSGIVAGCGIAAGAQYGESDQTASSPKDKPVHPNDLLATVYYALGIDPDMQVLNSLNQPRELVKGKPVTDLWG